MTPLKLEHQLHDVQDTCPKKPFSLFPIFPFSSLQKIGELQKKTEKRGFIGPKESHFCHISVMWMLDPHSSWVQLLRSGLEVSKTTKEKHSFRPAFFTTCAAPRVSNTMLFPGAPAFKIQACATWLRFILLVWVLFETVRKLHGSWVRRTNASWMICPSEKALVVSEASSQASGWQWGKQNGGTTVPVSSQTRTTMTNSSSWRTLSGWMWERLATKEQFNSLFVTTTVPQHTWYACPSHSVTNPVLRQLLHKVIAARFEQRYLPALNGG